MINQNYNLLQLTYLRLTYRLKEVTFILYLVRCLVQEDNGTNIQTSHKLELADALPQNIEPDLFKKLSKQINN